jgi:hypothetical protein
VVLRDRVVHLGRGPGDGHDEGEVEQQLARDRPQSVGATTTSPGPRRFGTGRSPPA